MQAEPIGAFVILRNDKNQLLLGKRKNAYKSGHYGFPGGRTEMLEPFTETVIRELQEELGIEAQESKYIGVIREFQETHNFIHFVFVCTKWSGDIKNMEPDKCEGWQWYDPNTLPTPLLPAHQAALELLKNPERALIDLTKV